MLDLLYQVGQPLTVAVLVPILMFGLKWIIPRLPGPLIPVIAGAIGPGVDWIVASLASIEASDPATAALVGLAGVGVREVADQLGKALAAKMRAGNGTGTKLKSSAIAGLLALAAAGLSLPGCTASDALVARQLTIVDGAAFVAENHARRQEIRRQLYDFENEVIAACRDWARAAKFDQDMAEARNRIQVCLDFIAESYPNLATIEALREGADALNDLRARLRGEQP